MAYNAEINVSVKNLNQVTDLEAKLSSISRNVNALNKGTGGGRRGGGGGGGSAKSELSDEQKRVQLENKRLTIQNRGLGVTRQVVDLQTKGKNLDEAANNLAKVKALTDQDQLDLAKNKILLADQQVKKKSLLLKAEQAINAEAAKSKEIRGLGPSSPVFGRPGQIGSAANMAAINQDPLTSVSPVQRKLQEMEKRSARNQKQAELRRKKSLSIGQSNIKNLKAELRLEKAKGIAANKTVDARRRQIQTGITPQGDFSRLSDRQSRNREGRRTFMNNPFGRMGIRPTRGFDAQSALISGGFPLLFGQGPGVAAAGALGGGIGGMFGQMGGFAGGIAATAAVQLIQNAINAISELGQAMGPFTQNTQAVTDALGLQGSAEEARIKLIEQTKGKTAAFNAAMNLMASQIGQKGVDSIKQFGDSTRLLGSQFTFALSKLQAFTAGIANFVIKITGLQDSLEAGAATRTVAAAAGEGDAEAQALVDRRKAAQSMKGQGGAGARKKALLDQISAEEKIFAIRRNTTIEADNLTQKFDALVKSITDEADETNRIIELRKQGLNPAVAKTIAGLEKEAKTNKENLQFEIDKLLEKQKQEAILGEADQTRLTLLEAQRNAIDGTVESTSNAVKEQDKLTRAATETLDKFKQIETAILGDIKNGIAGLIKGTSNLSDLLNNVADKFLDVALNQALFGNAGGSTVTGGLFKLLGFANGGRPPVGKPSIVGEKGPELFVPRSSGTIVPNNKLGGGGSTNVVVNVDASGTDVQGDEAQARELGTLISIAVKGELVKQQRPGGLLTK